MEIDGVTLFFVVFIILFGIVIPVVSYSNQNAVNSAKSEVFEKITDNTTNREIVEYIHTICSHQPWYLFQSDCESALLKTFITPTK